MDGNNGEEWEIDPQYWELLVNMSPQILRYVKQSLKGNLSNLGAGVVVLENCGQIFENASRIKISSPV